MAGYYLGSAGPFGHLAIILIAFLLSLAATIVMERLAPDLGLVQPPNQRSSHTIPTPRGGGLGAAIIGIGACFILGLFGEAHLTVIAVLAAAITALGFLDDLYDLPAALRFGVQALILSALVLTLPPTLGNSLPVGMEWAGWAFGLAIVIFGLWWINLFNFMDGIDGIAASQTILILFGAIALGALQNLEFVNTDIALMTMIVGATAAGFLLRNLPPAKIFMGDAGSNFYALMILAVALLSIGAGIISLCGWLALCSVFVTDATITLLRRTIRGERPWRAHRRHAYQQLSRRWGHGRVTLIYAGLTLFWAIPMAGLTSFFPHMEGAILVITFIPLTIMALWAGAGAADET